MAGELLPDEALVGITERLQYQALAVAVPVPDRPGPIRRARYALPTRVGSRAEATVVTGRPRRAVTRVEVLRVESRKDRHVIYLVRHHRVIRCLVPR